MLQGRKEHELVSIDSCLFALGGINRDNNYLNTVEKIEKHLQRWIFAPPMIERRCGFGAAVIDGLPNLTFN